MSRCSRSLYSGIGNGIAINRPALGYDAGVVAWLNAMMPDLAPDTWTTLRDRFLDFDGAGCAPARQLTRPRRPRQPQRDQR